MYLITVRVNALTERGSITEQYFLKFFIKLPQSTKRTYLLIYMNDNACQCFLTPYIGTFVLG